MNQFWVVKGTYIDPADSEPLPRDVYMSLATGGEVHWHDSIRLSSHYPARAQAEQAMQHAVLGDPQEIFEPVLVEVNAHPTGKP